MGSRQSPGVPRMDTGRRASASIGARSGRRRADKAAGSPANRADGSVEPGSGPDTTPARTTPLDLADVTPADTSNTRLQCPIPATHATLRHCATSRGLVFVEANAPGVPILDIFVQPGVAPGVAISPAQPRPGRRVADRRLPVRPRYQESRGHRHRRPRHRPAQHRCAHCGHAGGRTRPKLALQKPSIERDRT
jgi:hypothetical protein